MDANGQIEDHALQARFERITHELRCLVCQNESIADSNVELAGDLRRQVREMLIAGRSDDAIFGFMTDRYGEFVRFSPPLEPKTLLIWGAPFIVLLLGGAIIYRVARQRSRMPLDDEPASGPLTQPMNTFLVIAAVMAAVAAIAVALPLLRDRQSRVLGALVAVIVIGAAAGLYPLWSNWNWHAPAQPQAAAGPDVAAMVARLEQRLRDQPNDLTGWLMLGALLCGVESPRRRHGRPTIMHTSWTAGARRRRWAWARP